MNRGFWTSCPHCCHVHQYVREYLKRKLRCRVCRSPFVAEELSSPPPIVPGTDMYYCSWGFFPLGFPQGTGSNPPSNWTPLIPARTNPSSGDQPGKKLTARRKVCVSKRTNREDLEDEEEEDEGIIKGIDVNEEARVSDLMGNDNNNDGDDNNGGVNNGGIGYDIDVDMDATEEIFGLW